MSTPRGETASYPKITAFLEFLGIVLTLKAAFFLTEHTEYTEKKQKSCSHSPVILVILPVRETSGEKNFDLYS